MTTNKEQRTAIVTGWTHVICKCDACLKAKLTSQVASEAVCSVCKGNDKNVPCAYTTEKPQGCLRSDRLATPSPDVLVEAVKNLIKVKGRHNTEIAMNRLQEALATYSNDSVTITKAEYDELLNYKFMYESVSK